MPIKTYSTTASSNNASPPNGFPEGMAPASLNDGMRQVMADIRSWYEDPAWIDLGDTPTYIGTTSFSLVGDKTATYAVGRRIRAIGTTPFTIYGTIATSVFSSVTTVTVTWDSGTLNATLNAVALNIVQSSIADLRLTNIFATSSSGVLIKNNSGVTVLTLGASGGTGATFAGAVNIGGKTSTVASATGGAGLNVPHGTAPTSPVNGDIWTTTAGTFVRINGVTQAIGALPNGSIRDSAYAQYASNADLTTAIPYDDTIPQVTEGTEILSAAITPKTTTNKVRIIANIAGAQSGSANVYLGVAVFVNGGANAIVAKAMHMPNNSQGSHECVIDFEHSPASVSTQTYTVRVGLNTGTVRLNGTTSGRIYGGAQVCTITLQEIVA